MSERDIPALQHNPHWLMNEPDLLPRFDRPTKSRTQAGARMPLATGSGYEQIIAARTAMRARVDRATGWHASIDVAPPRAFVTKSSAERPPLRARHRRPVLAVAGLLAAPPACFLLAFVWIGAARSPTARVDGPARSVQASLPTSGTAVPAAGAERPEFALRDRYAPPRMETAEPGTPEEYASLGSAPAGAADAAVALSERDEPVVAARNAGVPRWAFNIEPGTPEESVSSRSAPAGAEYGSAAPLAEEEPAFAAWDGAARPWTVAIEPDASPSGAAPAAAPGPAEGEPGSASIEAEEPVLAARHQDAPVWAAGAGAETLHGREPATDAGGAGPAADASATAPNVWTAPEGVPSVSAAAASADAAGLKAEKEAARVPATAAPVDREPAPGADSALARPDERSPATAPATTPPARPITAADAALAAASVATAAGASAHAAPVELPARPAAPQGRVATSAALPPTGAAPLAKPGPGKAAAPASRVAVRDAPPSSPSPDSRCRAIVLKAQLGEETTHAERSLLRSGCGARR